MAATQGRQGLRGVQGPGLRHRRVGDGRRRRGRRERRLVRPVDPDGQADPDGRVPRAWAQVGVGRLRRARAGRGGRGRRRWRSRRCSRCCGTSEYVDERDARFINDRVHANIQRDGTFSVVPQIKGGVTNAEQLRRIADVADKYDDPDDQDHRRTADRPARRAQGGPARGLGRPRHALGLRLRQVVPHGEDVRRHRLLPLRPRRLHGARRATSSSATRASTARRR